MSKLSDDASRVCNAFADLINAQGEQLRAQGYSADEAFAILATALTHCSAATLSQRAKSSAGGELGFAIAVGIFARQMMQCGGELFAPASPVTAPDGRPLQ